MRRVDRGLPPVGSLSISEFRYHELVPQHFSNHGTRRSRADRGSSHRSLAKTGAWQPHACTQRAHDYHQVADIAGKRIPSIIGATATRRGKAFMPSSSAPA